MHMICIRICNWSFKLHNVREFELYWISGAQCKYGAYKNVGGIKRDKDFSLGTPNFFAFLLDGWDTRFEKTERRGSIAKT